MKIVELEIARQDWKSYRCGCGKLGSHIAKDLLALARAQYESEVRFDVAGGHVMVPEVLSELALPVLSVALAALADDISVPARHQFLDALLGILSADTQTFEAAQQGRDLVSECRAAAQSGVWLLYREVFFGASCGASTMAYEILALIEDDPDRLKRVQASPDAQLYPDVRNAEL
ncbi:hypothetical protein [Micromonospora sagamiensis]|uniref:Uncharacterized protein n=1 Tax=Micromonospora sagamiensis TaxID=47875 RepID=A0A562WFX4_9ACTN|nr:hypothetical protein [Micromonospora sagamiensis]TWJ28454.1 hypothetical protein JD81_01958 [Micromonospora sagamiensis]BCL12655.1 hypothetical protein GCM10017556_03940 [Micromonospora sagamiensis]